MDTVERIRVQEALELGLQARKQADPEAALKYFQNAEAANPDDPRPKLQIARTLLMLSRADEAEAVVRSILNKRADNGPALMVLGRLLVSSERFDEAEAVLQRAAEATPRDTTPLQTLFALICRRDPTRARAWLAAGIDAGRISPAAHFKLALELREQGQLDEACRELRAAIGRDRTNVVAILELGRLEHRCGRPEAALDAFKSALQVEPAHVHALVEAAIEERFLGRPHEAERLLQQALNQDPNDLRTLLQLADQARLAEEDGDALKWCHRAIAAHPNVLQPYLTASRAAVSAGRPDTAVAMLDHAATLFKDHPSIPARRLEMLRQAGERKEAAAVLNALPSDLANSSPIWAQRVELLLASGEYDAAEAALQAPPVRSGFSMGRVHVFRGLLAEARWRFDEAAACFREALTIQHSDSTARTGLARAEMLLLDFESAKENLAIAARLQASTRLLRGLSTNVSQSFAGQLLNEFMLDRKVVEELRRAAELPIAARLMLLQDIVRRAPDNTAAAIIFLINMRIAGRFDAAQPRVESLPAIPRRITQYWDAADPPPSVVAIMQSWRDCHPSWQYCRFDDAKAQEFLRTHHPTDVLRAYMRAQNAAQKADVFRLAYLVIEGGFYVDADDRCLQSLDTIVPPHVELATYQEMHGTIGNNFLGARPGEPVLAIALDRAVQAINRGDHDLLWLSTGPGLMTRTMARLFSIPADCDQLLRRALVLDRSELFRAVAVHCRLHYKRAAGHWAQSVFQVSRNVRLTGAATAPLSVKTSTGGNAVEELNEAPG